MLAKDIFDKIFASPFLPFAEYNKTPALPSAADMATLYQKMMNDKPHSAPLALGRSNTTISR
jgi:hypothetical protein